MWDNEFGRVGWWVSVSVCVSLGGVGCVLDGGGCECGCVTG